MIPPHANYVGEVQGNLGSVAIVVHDTFAVAYFCNGKTQEAWFRGTPQNGNLSMTGKANSSLTANYALGHARGTVTVNGIAHVFSIIAVHKPSGLFQSIAIVRGATVKAGWIVLPDGTTEVGSLEPDSSLAAPPAQARAEARPVHPDRERRRHHDHRHADRRRNRQRVLTPPVDQEGKRTWRHSGSRPRRPGWNRSSRPSPPGCSSSPCSSAASWR